MATHRFIHKRVGNDIYMTAQVIDNGVALDWTAVTHIFASLFSDAQRVRMGLCTVEGPDEQDHTKLKLRYSAKMPQYTGVARLVLECNYMGQVATYDAPAFVFVATTEQEGTDPINVEIDLQMVVADVDTSVLNGAIQQAYAAADAANQAAENADQSVAHFKGGSTGQVLAKKSGADYDFEWQNAGGVGAPVWGNITGELDDQTDLKNALAAKQDAIANLATIESGAAAGATAVQPGDLATVATTGDYDDLLNKPSIPAAQVNADWDAASGVAQILNKPTIPAAPGTLDTTATTAQATNASEALSGSVVLHKISKTGDYGDLLNKPTIDATPTDSSTNAVQSGGVYSALADRYTKTELAALAETWTFTLDDNSTVTKKIIVLP